MFRMRGSSKIKAVVDAIAPPLALEPRPRLALPPYVLRSPAEYHATQQIRPPQRL